MDVDSDKYTFTEKLAWGAFTGGCIVAELLLIFLALALIGHMASG